MPVSVKSKLQTQLAFLVFAELKRLKRDSERSDSDRRCRRIKPEVGTCKTALAKRKQVNKKAEVPVCLKNGFLTVFLILYIYIDEVSFTFKV